MVDPKLHLGDERDCPEDAITTTILGGKAAVLFGKLWAWAGLAGTEEVAKASARFLKDKPGAAGEPGGAAVRDSAN